MPPVASNPLSPLPFAPQFSPNDGAPAMFAQEQAGSFNSHVQAPAFEASSWDLATGGLKTLTAKRELPRMDRRPSEVLKSPPHPVRSYRFLLLILACVLVMLISGGIVLFMMLQP